MNKHVTQLLAFIIFSLSFTAVSAQGIYYSGVCDVSAAIVIGDSHFLVAEDENDILLLYAINKPGSSALKTFNFSAKLQTEPNKESDIEAAARVKDRIYWMTSHGRNSKGKIRKNRYQLFATDIKNESAALELSWVGSYHKLIHDAVDKTSWQNPNDKEVAATISFLSKATRLDDKKDKRLAPKRNGLNIEALAALPDHKGLLIGLRNPLYQAKALVIQLKNPDDLLTKNGARSKFGPPLYLDLDGLGLRSMTYSRTREKFLIIAGKKSSGGPFKLFEWDFENKSPPVLIRELSFSEGSHPEALFSHGSQVHVLHDEGSRLLDGDECKDKNQQQKRFSFHTYSD